MMTFNGIDISQHGYPPVREQIESAFAGKLFERPLFYSCPGGLRFELSDEGREGTTIAMFLQAMHKATSVCRDIFQGEDHYLLCLRDHNRDSAFAHRQCLRERQGAGIAIPKQRSLWLEPLPQHEWFDANIPEYWVTLAFEVPLNLLQSALWCALSLDYWAIRPQPSCLVYLVNLSQRIAAFPYDDRGMDVIGPNHDLLARLYAQHHAWLLNYDRARMAATFGSIEPGV